ncbi:MAG: ABC transporter permease [Dethiobacter sp.]|nr:MAG: ABC transporter permease [Dethiobacter sp.]
MGKIIIQRLVISILVMLAASFLSYFFLYMAPGDPAVSIIKSQTGREPTQAEIEIFRENRNLNIPLLDNITIWFGMLSKGDLGISVRTGEPVLHEFKDRFGATFLLAVISLVLAVLIAFPLGVLAATRPGSVVDHVTRVIGLGILSIPEFWLGLMLMVLFSLTLKWLPSFGYGTIYHFILPTVTLSTGMSALLMRLMRASMLEVLNLDYIKMARSKGLNRPLIIWKHAFRNALIPVITIIGTQFGHLLAGTIIIETVFSWPGIGKYLVDSIYARDYPVIQGFVFIIAAMFVVINLLVDLSYAYLDPRIRFEQGRN